MSLKREHLVPRRRSLDKRSARRIVGLLQIPSRQAMHSMFPALADGKKWTAPGNEVGKRGSFGNFERIDCMWMREYVVQVWTKKFLKKLTKLPANIQTVEFFKGQTDSDL